MSGATGSAGGVRYSSTTRQALAPPPPKELTTARSGTSPSPAAGTQGWRVCCTSKGVVAKSMPGLRRAAFSEGTSVRWRSWNSTLVRPATPAADSRWPMLDFTEPTATVGPSARSVASMRPPKASTSPAISTGSPSGVPVPWAST